MYLFEGFTLHAIAVWTNEVNSELIFQDSIYKIASLLSPRAKIIL